MPETPQEGVVLKPRQNGTSQSDPRAPQQRSAEPEPRPGARAWRECSVWEPRWGDQNGEDAGSGRSSFQDLPAKGHGGGAVVPDETNETSSGPFNLIIYYLFIYTALIKVKEL